MLEVIGKSIINRRLILTRHYKMQWQKERWDWLRTTNWTEKPRIL